MIANKKISVIGGGSWATAIVKILSEQKKSQKDFSSLFINWWVRSPENASHLKQFYYNKNYLSNAKLNFENINVSSNINDVIKDSEYVILAVPSAFLQSTLSNLSVDLKNKVVVSAIKGIIPQKNTVVGKFIHEEYGVPYNNIGVLTGPCHAEEIAIEKLSYLTIAFSDLKKSEFLANHIHCKYVIPSISDDVHGVEYSSVLKNIIAIAVGICDSLKYGDNFQSVLISNAIREINTVLNAISPMKRDINESAYLGDLIVTSYSKFSRNRRFGIMIGEGLGAQESHLKLGMVAEGYYAVKCIMEINELCKIKMPIITSVYNILYENASVKKEIFSLTKSLT